MFEIHLKWGPRAAAMDRSQGFSYTRLKWLDMV